MHQRASENPIDAFHFSPQPQAEKLVRELVDEFVSKNAFAADLSRRMKDESGTRFYDWVETIIMPDSQSLRQKVQSVGYQKFRDADGEYDRIYSNSHGMFARIGFHDQKTTAIHLKVGSVADFAAVWQLQEPIEGEELVYRRIRASAQADTELWAAERWGWVGFDLPPVDAARSRSASRWLETFRARRRDFEDDAEGFVHANKLIDSCPLSANLKCALWFEAERDYWQRRNRAGRVQKARQDALGLGWGNHDHHTYRSSREHFAALVALWEKLGFYCRERFYAGREAGWGAQVMEQPATGIITFNDVDLTPDELMGDFSHQGLSPQSKLGTVGLWCGLHGEAVLQAGMHHLEAQFDFVQLRDQLASEDVKMMKPFTDFPYLRQAFTEGERWKVDDRRIEKTLQRGYITQEQAKQFREQGAIGSHLENLERNEGFKGFNQKGVSEIISETDPRKQAKLGPKNLTGVAADG
jgi:hypothetical protein